MKQATTIEEVYNAFIPGKPLNEDESFLVDLSERALKRLSTDMFYTPDEQKTYLIAGQSGNGKSTFLNMLSKKESSLTKRYDFKYIKTREAFKYIADIIFNLAYEIIKDDSQLQDRFIKELEELEDKHNKNIEERIEKTSKEEDKTTLKSLIGAGANILGLFQAKSNISQDYQFDELVKKSSVEFFEFKKQDLFELLNTIILDYKLKTKKDIVVIIDDLEKRDDVNHLFLEHTQLALLDTLNIIKIISMPIHLARASSVRFGDIQESALKLKDRDDKSCDGDKELLREIIKRRISNNELIDDESIEKIIEKSGANLNQLISLVHKSALNALANETEFINIEDVDNAISEIRRSHSSFVLNQRDFLNNVNDKRNIDFSEEENISKLQKATANGILFAYFNGDTWYDINPICKESLKEHNANIN